MAVAGMASREDVQIAGENGFSRLHTSLGVLRPADDPTHRDSLVRARRRIASEDGPEETQLLAGKIYETWIMLAKRFSVSEKTAQQDAVIAGLAEKHQASLKWLREYFSGKGANNNEVSVRIFFPHTASFSRRLSRTPIGMTNPLFNSLEDFGGRDL
jgi:hypothetical protein